MSTFLHWNARSILPKRHWLSHSFFSSAHVIAIQETFLKPTTAFSIPQFQIYRKDRLNRPGGGLLFAIKNSIPSRLLNLSPDPSGTSEILGVEIFYGDNPVSILNFYNPLGRINFSWLESILDSISSPVLLVGDFNIDIRHVSQHRTFELLDWFNEQNLHLLNRHSPTRFANEQSSSLLDLSLCSSDIFLQTSIYIHPDSFDSDHHPVAVTTYSLIPSQPVFHTKRFIKWKKVEISINSLCQNKIDFNSQFQHDCRQILQTHTSTIQWQYNSSFPPYWDASCSLLLAQKRKLARLAKQHLSPHLWAEHKKLAARLKKLIKSKSRSYWDNKCRQVSRDGHLFSLIKNLSHKFRPNSDLIFFKNNHIITSAHHQAEEFLQHFLQKQVNPPIPYVLITDHAYLNLPFSIHELNYALNRTKNSTPGADGISAKLFHQFNDNSRLQLLTTFNEYFDNGIVPSSWTKAIIVPIKKPNKPDYQFNSYRPIALTDVSAKIFERILLQRIINHLITNNIIHPYHFGFMPKRGCQSALSTIHNDISVARRNHQFIFLASLDIKNAYDCVWIDGLLHKCASIGLGGKLGNWLQNFLTHRQYQVKWRGFFSSTSSCYTGVPQGGVLSAILFTIFLYDIFEVLHHNVKLIIYADDLFVYAIGENPQRTLSNLQETINDIIRWCAYWRLEICSEKTKIINFSRARKFIPPIFINSISLSWLSEIRILGFWFNTKFNLSTHLNILKDKALVQNNLLRSVCNRKWGISCKHAISFVNSTIRSLLEFATPIINLANKTEQHTINVIYNNALRAATHLPRCTPIPVLRKVSAQQDIIPRIQFLCQKFLIYQMADRHISPHGQYLFDISHLNSPHQSVLLNSLLDFLDYSNIDVDQILLSPNSYSQSNNDVYTVITSGLPFQDKSLPIQCIKNLWNEYYQQNLSNHYILATDASKDDHKTSFAVIDTQRKNNFASLVHHYNSVFTAETLAIEHAISSCLTSPGNYAILSDSFACLSALININAKSPTSVKRLHNIIIQKSSLNCKISIIWVPGHSDITYNNQADLLAKKGPFTSVFNQIDCADICSKMKTFQDDTSLYIWLNAKYFNSHSYLSDIDIHKVLNFGLNKSQEHILFRWLTQQIITNKYLHRIGRKDSPLCDYCYTEDSSYHVLLECNLYDRQRRQLFTKLCISNPSYHTIMISAHLNFKNAIALCNFTSTIVHYN